MKPAVRSDKSPKNQALEGTPGLDNFFSVISARLVLWRDLARAAPAWSARGEGAAALSAECARRLEALRPFESLQAYPGPRLLAALTERVSSGDARGTLRLVQRVSSALMSRAYRSESGEQVATRIEAQSVANVKPASPESGESAKPVE